ncbi:molybdopterin biosynthesis protein [Pseudothermotoga thermarum]|uniref:Molybdopterin molybdenumtransferase n=1 Tax=Pseudothermotoga thermarum DSM 5069 TaxID=688269 RepID=F7YW47_9THEM|nr:molybdopterin biosynthesis protein [Pseudothermotoga thermarum]AEH50536.1 molybdenum cofactor synthesis domain protein [Pseudothermotoga thermarum DSM 5069]
MRKIYLHRLDLPEALDKYIKKLDETGFFKVESEVIPTRLALNRVLAGSVYARKSVPMFISAAMDGIAVQSQHTVGATKANPKRLKKDQFVFINTGNPMPEGFDAVIMIEDVNIVDEETVEIYESVPPYHNVRMIGEDVCEGDMIFTRYHLLKPQDLALLLAVGVFEVEVVKKMKACMIPTGTEIVEPEKITNDLHIPETNSVIVKNFLSMLGVDVEVLPPVPDDPTIIKEIVQNIAHDFDMILLGAGSSAGTVDYSYQVAEDLAEVIVHGINIRPGKPTILAVLKTNPGKPLIGLPGYPGSCYVILEEIVKPIVLRKYKLILPKSERIYAVSTRRISSSISDDEIIRVSVGKVLDKYFFIPLKRGAAVMEPLTKMDGKVVIPRGVEIVEEGELCQVETSKSLEEIDKNILFVGSNDPIISILADFVKKYDYTIGMSISNVGSMGGLAAIAKKQAHIAGIHLLDAESGEYNIPYLKKYLENFVLMKFVKRSQGLIVQKGNPKNIKSLLDLTKKGVRFVNRQKASGTRILLDYHLQKLGIDPSHIEGYQDEEFTHLGVALKVKNGFADVGLGIALAAEIFNLDFIPLFWEEYDLLFLPEFLHDERFQLLLDVISSKDFLDFASKLKGYDLGQISKIIKSGDLT